MESRNINITPEFVVAGSATFTVSSVEDGVHYTYHIYRARPTPKYPEPALFIKVMTGPDDYTYMGRVVVPRDWHTKDPHIHLTQGSKFHPTSKSVLVANWAIKVVWQVWRKQYSLPSQYTIHHNGRCGRCGRELTHPASLDTGLGPDCAEMLGVDWAERGAKYGDLLTPAGGVQ